MPKTKKVDLIPPDPKRCQAKRRVGCWPDGRHFMNLGPAAHQRCDNRPISIVHEKKAAKSDGLKGAMSLCAECLAKFIDQNGGDLRHYRVEHLKQKLIKL